jgi:hypothetical protein
MNIKVTGCEDCVLSYLDREEYDNCAITHNLLTRDVETNKLNTPSTCPLKKEPVTISL